ATGFDGVDIEAARERQIAVTNVPGYATRAVSQFTIGLILEIVLHIGRHNQRVQEGQWVRQADFGYQDCPMRELAGLTLGIIGPGRIGQAAAVIARSLGLDVITDQEYSSGHGGIFRPVPLETLWAVSDIISLHCPLNDATRCLINDQTLARTKKGVIIINTARGGLIDDAALARALISGQAGFAGLDVISKEPIAPDNPLLGLPNCLITPHMAARARETRQRLIDMAYDNFLKFQQGSPQNLVCPLQPV
ncbi:MAG: D-2-hydroxyacid dehydrogenase, partial [Deltaproteobacteria bacterium]|nr:D-2-hydroxyacid dehydrogenase [Deltaproteobacteria bacterium]